ncbi:TRMT1-like protein isoform X3 [Pomacea canaliculata]|uniref:TRMT1-like protein isoform X3 n=1 Tax=Pomacea canaliculata TaxID=400727 RepID=UPI000D72704B|nr:TRMT1-like protein isoform X3 [Pomacea canaliculata]XP_025112397.1 TRMT1-like protein isoform X3 [Pomacea canaliculata]
MAMEISENGVTVKFPDSKKGKYLPKTAVFRDFALATSALFANEHKEKLSAGNDEETRRSQFCACDLTAYSGIAGLQWKHHLGADVHVTLVELREPQLLKDNAVQNGLTVSHLPLNPAVPAGASLPSQSALEVHVAQCDGKVLMLLEAFNFIFVDSYKNPSLYFSTLFRNVRNGGVVCVVVPDVLHFARTPHVVRRSYSATCIRTEYIKELAARIIVASLAVEAARSNKGICVLYTVSLEDALLISIRVTKGPKIADDTLQSIAHVLHCRICEERTFYPENMAPVEAPYSMLGCDCHKKIPGKTAVILGPLWKGSLFDWPCLQKLIEAGRKITLSKTYYDLLQKVLEDCLCNSPVVDLLNINQSGFHDGHKSVAAETLASRNTDVSGEMKPPPLDSQYDIDIKKNSNENNKTLTSSDLGRETQTGKCSSGECAAKKKEDTRRSKELCDPDHSEMGQIACEENTAVERNFPKQEHFKREASTRDLGSRDGVPDSKRPCYADVKYTGVAPAPPFYYSVHSKKLGKVRLPNGGQWNGGCRKRTLHDKQY